MVSWRHWLGTWASQGSELAEVEDGGFGDGAIWVGLFDATAFGASDDDLGAFSDELSGEFEG